MKKIFQIKKQRSFSAVIEDSFRFFRINAKNIIKIVWEQNRIVLTALVITYFLYVYFYFGQLNDAFTFIKGNTITSKTEASPNFILVAVILFILTLIFAPRFFAAVAGYFSAYDEQTGQVDVAKIQELVRKKFWGLIGLTLVIFILALLIFLFTSLILGGVMVGLGGTIGAILFVFIYIFMIIVGVLYFGLSYYVYFYEDIGFAEAIFKTRAYLKDKFWYSFGIFILMVLIIWLISLVINAPVTLYALLKSLWMAKDSEIAKYAGQGDLIVAIISIISFIGQMILRILMIISMALLYFSLREHKTGESLLGKINQIGSKEDVENF